MIFKKNVLMLILGETFTKKEHFENLKCSFFALVKQTWQLLSRRI